MLKLNRTRTKRKVIVLFAKFNNSIGRILPIRKKTIIKIHRRTEEFDSFIDDLPLTIMRSSVAEY